MLYGSNAILKSIAPLWVWGMRKRRKMSQAGSVRTDLRETSRKRVLSVAYWRFFVNALLVFCDMASFILAAVVVLMTQSEINLYSSRFHFHINLWAYVVVCALVWVFCLHSVGVYHRHVMGDGYQLNVLLFKGAVFAGLMICAFELILNIYVSLLSTVLELLGALLVTMVVRLAVRQFVLFKRKRGTYSYGTVVVGSLEGIEHALQFLSQKSQLNYHAIAICPIGLDAQTGYVKAIDVPAEFKQRIRKICGRDIATLPYCKNFAERAVSMGVQTVMVTDVMHRFSDNFNTFVLGVEAMNLEVALITSAVDVSGHETNIRVIQGSTVMTISLPQDDRSYSSRNEMFETIVSFLGGRVAEAQKLCDISTGASNDLQRATGIARDMVAKYGMSDSIGPVSYAGGQEVFIGRDYEKTKPYSEQTAGQIDAQVQKIMREAYQRCEQILRDHAERLDKIAGFLMENENMSRAQFEAVMQDETLDQPKA